MKTELHQSPQGDSFVTPENHTLFDWNTLDEFSDLKRLEMVFTSLSAAGETTLRCKSCGAQQLRESSFNTTRPNMWCVSIIAILDYCSFPVFIRCYVKVRCFTSFAAIRKLARVSPTQSANHASIRSPTNGTLHASSSG